MLKIKNTLTGQIEEFKPIQDDNVGMYNCGPTVYNFAHIGNLRAYVFADLLRRVLEMNDYKVKQVINITDVGHLTSDADEGEDKVEKRAREESKSAKEITTEVTNKFFEDLDKLNIDRSKIEFPKASEHIQEQIDLINELGEKDLIYKTSDGIYFDTSKFEDYGKLGGIDLKGLEEGARVKTNNEKENPTDFALWKFSRDEKRQQEWDAPWGKGFPGWHIECSAMARKYLGKTFDIHTGGIDHIGTHHNNEIAQSESANDSILANYWVHSNHITINGEKISKSLGNGILIDNLIERGFNPLSYKYWLYQAHYSTLVNFTWEGIRAAQKALYKIYEFLNKTQKTGEVIEKYTKEFQESVNNDLNTPKALSIVFEVIGETKHSDEDKKATLLEFNKVLNLGFNNPQINTQIPPEINDLAIQRQEFREKGNFEKADELREEIYKKGFEIKDIDNSFEIKRIF